MKLIADCAAKTSSLARYDPVVESLGKTLEGREIECLSIGTGDLNAWVQHRQHPGETMAEFYAEGLCRRLFGLEADSELDETTRRVLEKYRIHVVPNMCPDGSVLGHLRTNSVGANLNREWATVAGDYEAPSAERSPEVFAVLSGRCGCELRELLSDSLTFESQTATSRDGPERLRLFLGRAWRRGRCPPAQLI